MAVLGGGSPVESGGHLAPDRFAKAHKPVVKSQDLFFGKRCGREKERDKHPSVPNPW